MALHAVAIVTARHDAVSISLSLFFFSEMTMDPLLTIEVLSPPTPVLPQNPRDILIGLK